MRLTIICATRVEAHVLPFLTAMQELASTCGGELLLVVDGREAWERLEALGWTPDRAVLAQQGVHAQVRTELSYCQGQYIFFLDDDERCTAKLTDWLATDDHLRSPVWRFPRAWLWQDDQHYLISHPHWPDYQRRLARKEHAIVPDVIHGGWVKKQIKSDVASFAIEHHKLLLRTRAEREATVAKYEQIMAGAGCPNYYLPEGRQITIAEWQG